MSGKDMNSSGNNIGRIGYEQRDCGGYHRRPSVQLRVFEM
jgi:hypothetical protein